MGTAIPFSSSKAALDSLYRISRMVGSTDDPKEALQGILREIVDVTKATSGSIALVNPDSNNLEIEVFIGLPDHSKEIQLELGRGVTGWVALHGKPLHVDDVTQDPRYYPVKATIQSEMAVPMEEQGAVIGVINVDSDQRGIWTEEHLKLMVLMASEASRVVSRLWLIQQLKQKASQLETMVDVSCRLVEKIDAQEILDNITQQLHEIMGCKIGAIFLLREDGNTLSLESISCRGTDSLADYHETVQLQDSSIGTAIVRRKQIEVLDLRWSEEHHFTEVAQEQNLVSFVATPMIADGQAIGVLNAYADRLHRFNNEERKILEALATLGAATIQNARLYARVFDSEETLRRNERLTTLGLLAAEIAHEIRNPLTVIKLLFEALTLDFEESDPRTKDAAIIQEKLDQLEDIVGRVLSFGKSREELHTRLSLGGLIQDTLRLVRLKLSQGKIAVSCGTIDSKLMIDGSKGQLQQVFLNIILNATQAMPRGGDIAITVTTAHDEGQAFADIAFADSGRGIPDDIRSRIFDDFLTGRSTGSGLGLAITRRIVESHRGSISLTDTSRQGTTITVRLPLAKKQR